ncbi:nuclease harbi1 [Lasius niger]|uniref:Nuclease harbi1 n=1 Tax=Lasius niger TaxID=67767 RepID=A0A0J7KE44_LASNI|nr:nuclease harbi1 [Lasius niger]
MYINKHPVPLKPEEEEEDIVDKRLRGSPNLVKRNVNFLEVTVPKYFDKQFREHFRMTRAIFSSLEERLGPALSRRECGRPRTPVCKARSWQSCGYWLLQNPFVCVSSLRSVGDRFNMGKSILHDCFVRLIDILNEEKDWEASQCYWGHGWQPPIPAPKVNSKYYVTRKCNHAITLQAVCDTDLVFTDCFVGFSGAVADIRVFRNSDLWREVLQDRQAYFPEEEYIIGDKAYPVLSWCIPPFINRGNLTRAQHIFNVALSEMRQVIERSFALLKGRFRRLKYLDMSRIDLISYVILACCVLHNIYIIGCEHEDNEDFINEGREQHLNNLRKQPIVEQINNEPDGMMKRDYLVNVIAQNGQ